MAIPAIAPPLRPVPELLLVLQALPLAALQENWKPVLPIVPESADSVTVAMALVQPKSEYSVNATVELPHVIPTLVVTPLLECPMHEPEANT